MLPEHCKIETGRMWLCIAPMNCIMNLKNHTVFSRREKYIFSFTVTIMYTKNILERKIKFIEY